MELTVTTYCLEDTVVFCILISLLRVGQNSLTLRNVHRAVNDFKSGSNKTILGNEWCRVISSPTVEGATSLDVSRHRKKLNPRQTIDSVGGLLMLQTKCNSLELTLPF
jgi:hypothetical protein